MSDNYFTVSQVNNYIKNIFEAEEMLQNICVFGEVSSYNISGGIAYFNIKDENGLLQCVLFGALNFESPKIGDTILVKGGINYYAKGGKLSFNAISIMPFGKGLLYEKFLKLKAKLESLGYFDSERKKPIPKYVKKIGVVSSPTGAVIRDIIDVTHRRNDTIDIVLYPAKVQGIGADIEIAKGIEFFSTYTSVDVIIVARGGGSAEDLEPFNSEIVATATYNSQKPIVSAVGHETDFTIIDFVADLRAPTPSAAAEIVAWRKDLMIDNINQNIGNLDKIINNKILFIQKDIDLYYEKIDNISSSKLLKIKNFVNLQANKLNNIINLLELKFKLVDNICIKLENTNPKKISDMGYSKIIQNDKVVSKISKLKDLDTTISMIDGEINCKIIR